MQHDGLSTRMGDLWRNLDAITTTDPARGFRTAEYTRSALNRRIHLVGYRKRYFVMQLGLRLLFLRASTLALLAWPASIERAGPCLRCTTTVTLLIGLVSYIFIL